MMGNTVKNKKKLSIRCYKQDKTKEIEIGIFSQCGLLFFQPIINSKES